MKTGKDSGLSRKNQTAGEKHELEKHELTELSRTRYPEKGNNEISRLSAGMKRITGSFLSAVMLNQIRATPESLAACATAAATAGPTLGSKAFGMI